MIAIYKITNKINNKIYIGSSINTKKRWSRHISNLNRNIHHSNHLQNAWNKYGKDNFVFSIIETLENDINLLEREQYWIDKYKSYIPQYGYNASRYANRAIHDEEALQKITNSINKYYAENPDAGKKIGDGMKLKEVHKGSKNPSAKLTEEQIIEIKTLINEGSHSLTSIAKRFNVSQSLISHIKSGRKWSHIII